MICDERFCRTISLLGKDKALKLANAKVMIIGCGAVGGYALECVARLGINNIVVVDFDLVELVFVVVLYLYFLFHFVYFFYLYFSFGLVYFLYLLVFEFELVVELEFAVVYC